MMNISCLACLNTFQSLQDSKVSKVSKRVGTSNRRLRVIKLRLLWSMVTGYVKTGPRIPKIRQIPKNKMDTWNIRQKYVQWKNRSKCATFTDFLSIFRKKAVSAHLLLLLALCGLTHSWFEQCQLLQCLLLWFLLVFVGFSKTDDVSRRIPN